MHPAVRSLSSLIDASDSPRQSLVVVNRTEVDPVQALLEEAFAGQAVAIEEMAFPSDASNVVALVRENEVVATSSLPTVMNACLLVNGDLYRTGLSGIEKHEAPAIITALDETVFELRGFPASNKEKLLLIIVSRFIERLALERGSGRLRATFQRLSRIGQELGTRGVYGRLSDADVELHLYGQDDGLLPDGVTATVHTGTHEGYRRSWCVSYVPEDPADRHAALVAIQIGHNAWRGTWTYDADRVREVDRILEEEF